MPSGYKRRPTGDFSRINIGAMEFAESLQTLALAAIRDQFGTANLGLDVTQAFTFNDYLKALEQAEREGTRDEFEADLGKQFALLLEQQAAAMEAEQQAQMEAQ